jgi:hypothetical protein
MAELGRMNDDPMKQSAGARRKERANGGEGWWRGETPKTTVNLPQSHPLPGSGGSSSLRHRCSGTKAGFAQDNSTIIRTWS